MRKTVERWLKTGVSALALSAFSITALAQTQNAQCTDDAILVFDGSRSMSKISSNNSDTSRIVEARRAVREALPHISPFRRMGLIVYGPGWIEECSNIRVKVRPMANAAPRIMEEIDTLTPFGNTPLTSAVRKAANELNYKENPAMVVLVTDGQETCGGSTCQVAEDLAAEGAALTVHVIGFQVAEDVTNESEKIAKYRSVVTDARCLAEKTGGIYVSTKTIEELTNALQQTLGCPLVGQTSINTRRKIL